MSTISKPLPITDAGVGLLPDVTNKWIFRLITVVSIFVFLVVFVLQTELLAIFPDKASIPSCVFFLPRLNAILNAICTALLLISLYCIKRKQIVLHTRLNVITFILSSFFLLSYIVFHATGIKTIYGGHGFIRYVYYFILITHVVLAAIVLPLILFSFQKGFQMQVEHHKRLVRFSYPIWLYVTITGVIIYFMIFPYYTF